MTYFLWGGTFHQDLLLPRNLRFVFWVAVFVAGNLAFPAVVHSFPQGGLIWLPIYFFTLIAAYRYGVWAGLATALLSPLVNHALTGMPPLPVLESLLVKSTLLALIAAGMAAWSKQVSLISLAIVISGYQVLGGAYEALRAGSLSAALGDWVLGWPGLLVQVFLGGLILGVWGRARQTDR